jgi:hypothetical protein
MDRQGPNPPLQTLTQWNIGRRVEKLLAGRPAISPDLFNPLTLTYLLTS